MSESTRGASSTLRQGADAGYTLHIVFSGIVPLVRERLTTGERLWVLVPDFRKPANLVPTIPDYLLPPEPHHQPGGKGPTPSHAHRSRFLAPTGTFKSTGSGRTLQVGAHVCQEAGSFDFLDLQNEHLELAVPTSGWPSLSFKDGTIWGPVPCQPGNATPFGTCQATDPISVQEQDFGWAVDVDPILAATKKPGKPPPRLRTELFDPTYPPSGTTTPSLLSARFVFEHGEVTTRKLDRLANGSYRISEVVGPGSTLIWRHVVATQIRLSLPVTGNFVLNARALDDPTKDLDPIEIQNLAGGTDLTVFIENEPVNLDCTKPDRFDPHFHLNYHLLDHPENLESARAPQEAGGPTLNGQCSPPKYGKS